MAVIDDVREQWNKQKGTSVKHRIAYFMHYYLIWVIVIAAIVAFFTYLIHSAVTKKPAAYMAEFINTGATSDSVSDDLTKHVARAAGIDTDKEKIEIMTSRTLTPGGLQDQSDVGNNTAISAEMMNTSLDAMVCDEWNFYYYVETASFQDLRKVLSADELSGYKDDLYYVDLTEIKKIQEETQKPDYDGTTLEEKPADARASESYENFVKPDPSGMDDPVPVGIILSDSSYLKKNKLYPDAVPVFGFVNNSKHIDTSKQLLEFLMK